MELRRVPIRRALISVSDKTGLERLARGLHEAGVEIVSSGGTARYLAGHGIPVVPVEEVTAAPEMLDGRVKTLHPAIHGAILADLDRPEHRADLAGRGIEPIGLVVANLYPFEAVVAAGADADEVVEHIDVGGPTLIRAAAKNHRWVAVVVEPADYDEVLEAVASGGFTDERRRSLAAEAFFRTAAYDAAIVRWFEAEHRIPERLVLPLERIADLRYGENPHQEAGVFAERNEAGWWRAAEQLQGKAMSFNNFADAEAAWRLVHDLPRSAAVVVKHQNPCGAAIAEELPAAFRAAWDGDPLAAFGGIVAVNEPLDERTATELAPRFVEVVVAPAVEPRAREILAAKRNLRVLVAPPPGAGDLDLRRLERGFLVQVRDEVEPDPDRWEVVGRRPPTEGELADLALAWIVAAHTKSNAIVLAAGGAAVGIGAGDQSRVGAAERAVAKAGERARGAVAASDAFLPFRDGVDALAAAGVTALVEPGGSKRDAEVIAAADEHGLAVVFAGRRHFLH
ncbi:MAG TPA: bifunctional phosphoribosylaminoimidazolecarboxamide formyltransferase/IMP cyclohydrolase [Actinobacteria bacterium]|nr:bifunctional phosphoribosylaminoimidazolecarboxamide formyltransferase/IMP cyclohydrolase [Actinomycetota bacterium]